MRPRRGGRTLRSAMLLLTAAAFACNLPLAGGEPEPPVGAAPPGAELPAPGVEVLPAGEQPPASGVGPAGPEVPASTGSLDVSLTVSNPGPTALAAAPVTSGVPIPVGLALTDLSTLRLLDDTGQPVPAQFTPLARWGGSADDTTKPVRWLLLDFQADAPPGGSTTFRLVSGDLPQPAFPMLEVSDEGDAIRVNTGAAEFAVVKEDGRLLGPGGAILDGQAVDAEYNVYHTGAAAVNLTLQGPMRVSIQVKGDYRDENGRVLVEHTTRYWF